MEFLLTRPLRDVTLNLAFKHNMPQFLLTRPLRDVTTKRKTSCSEKTRFLLTRPLRDVTGEKKEEKEA